MVLQNLISASDYHLICNGLIILNDLHSSFDIYYLVQPAVTHVCMQVSEAGKGKLAGLCIILLTCIMQAVHMCAYYY